MKAATCMLRSGLPACCKATTGGSWLVQDLLCHPSQGELARGEPGKLAGSKDTFSGALQGFVVQALPESEGNQPAAP